jgi:H+/Cl- antiporter ClcA
VAICGAIAGFISRDVFRQRYTNVVRKHTLMGMAGALSAFFGVPLGGSLFALEVCSRFGVEYFEHLVESIFCGEICLVVFRSLSGLPMKPIWNMTGVTGRMFESTPAHVLWGGAIGLYGAFLAYCFSLFHFRNMAFFGKLNLLENDRAVYRGWLASIFIVLMSVLVPHTGKFLF